MFSFWQPKSAANFLITFEVGVARQEALKWQQIRACGKQEMNELASSVASISVLFAETFGRSRQHQRHQQQQPETSKAVSAN